MNALKEALLPADDTEIQNSTATRKPPPSDLVHNRWNAIVLRSWVAYRDIGNEYL